MEAPMSANQWITSVSVVALGVLLTTEPTLPQQVTGAPGSPSATTTIEGNQLPPPPQPFHGKIERNAAQSSPYWPMRVVPPQGAPNILLIMTDDTGFGVTSTFGGVVPTPTLDRIAANGLRFTIRLRFVRRPAPPSSPAATITRWVSASSLSSRPDTPATTAS
jgi:Sulfatase